MKRRNHCPLTYRARSSGRAVSSAGSRRCLASRDGVRSCFRYRGFTIVELIVVVILLGILSISAISRFVQPSAFSPGIVAEAAIAEIRFAQQLASSRRDAAVTFTMDRFGDDWRFRVTTDVDGLVRTELVEAENTTVQATSGALTNTVAGGTPLVLQFSHAGDLTAVTIGAAAGSPAMGVGLGIDGDSRRDACIYPSGYASAAACI